MSLLNELTAFYENHKFDDDKFDDEYNDEFDDEEYDKSFYMEEQTSKKLNIKISLIDSDPEIYRIVEVPSNIRLESFAEVINTAMGWEGYHLHLFQKGKQYIQPKNPMTIFGLISIIQSIPTLSL